MKKYVLSALCGILLTGSSAAAFAGDLYAGFRGSKIYPNNTPAYWANVGDAMTKNFTTSSTKPIPAAVWITSFYGDAGNIYATFPSGGTALPHVSFTSADYNEVFLTEFDKRGTHVWLQIEPGAASVDSLIDIVLTRYKNHRCVAGFGIDVEWLDQQLDSYGRPVTDVEAARWEKKVRGYDSSYTLFLKHFMKNRMPATYRGNIMFVDDSQQFTGFNNCISDFKAWGQAFAPSKVAFQFGYPDDRYWWSTLSNPPQTIGNALLSSIPNTAALVWVDFTITEVFPLATTSVGPSAAIADHSELDQNFPNPFNPSTQVSFFTAKRSRARMTLFNSLGQTVRMLLDDEMEPGTHRLTVDCSGLPAGVYFYRLTTEGFSQTKAMTLIR
jgi:hypothetical protein